MRTWVIIGKTKGCVVSTSYIYRECIYIRSNSYEENRVETIVGIRCSPLDSLNCREKSTKGFFINVTDTAANGFRASTTGPIDKEKEGNMIRRVVRIDGEVVSII